MHAHAATLNDVFLAVVAGGVRDLLEGRREPTGGLALKVAVPASLARPTPRVSWATRWGAS